MRVRKGAVFDPVWVVHVRIPCRYGKGVLQHSSLTCIMQMCCAHPADLHVAAFCPVDAVNMGFLRLEQLFRQQACDKQTRRQKSLRKEGTTAGRMSVNSVWVRGVNRSFSSLGSCRPECLSSILF